MNRSLIVLFAALVLALAACVSADPEFTTEDQVTAEQREQLEAEDEPEEVDEDELETIEFIADDNFYEGLPASVDTGQLEFVMENVGLAEHDLLVEETGDEEIIGRIAGGETGTGTTSLEPGEYTLYCSVPGHREDGMEETIVIEG